MYWNVVEVSVEEYLILSVRFADGLSGRVKFLPQYFSGVFTVLKDPEFFSKVFVEDGVVSWPGELDLAPDAIHAEIKKNGEWILS
jgi:hypothetical protein